MACTMFAAIDVGSYEVNLKIYELSTRKGIRVVNHVRHRMNSAGCFWIFRES